MSGTQIVLVVALVAYSGPVAFFGAGANRDCTVLAALCIVGLCALSLFGGAS